VVGLRSPGRSSSGGAPRGRGGGPKAQLGADPEGS
jgi:hypothetical protein